MKKKMIMLVAAAMMTLSASSAFAAFGSMSLIRVVSDLTAGSTTEVATDLGLVSTLAGLTNYTVADSFFGAGKATKGHDLYVNYYAWQSGISTKGTLDIATNNTTAPAAAGSTTLKSFLNSMNANYAAVSTANAGATTVVVANNAGNSLGNLFSLTSLGGYGGYTQSVSSNASVSLVSLTAATPTPVEMKLWQFASGTAITAGAQAAATPILTLTTNADGTTTINAPAPTAATPIPAAAWLLGSGLMGLFGLRRKMNA